MIMATTLGICGLSRRLTRGAMINDRNTAMIKGSTMEAVVFKTAPSIITTITVSKPFVAVVPFIVAT
jgi:hypothetical protein